MPVLPHNYYSVAAGYGFEPGPEVVGVENGKGNPLFTHYVTSNQPFYFSVKLPPGNYRVTAWLGDLAGTSATTIRAECRRAIAPQIRTAHGKISKVQFNVHIRDSSSAVGGPLLRLKEREHSYLHWDDKLTLEFNDSLPKLCALQIEPLQEAVTIFMAGNSTVVDQAGEPYAAWGQMFPVFFNYRKKVVVANYAESGEALSSFKSAGRLNKVLQQMKPGDYFFIEFAHNDQKQKGAGIGPWDNYTLLLKEYVEACRQRGGHPVLVTSMHRRSFDSTGKLTNTLGDYPAAMRKVAEELKVPLIDLHAMSEKLYNSWGPVESAKAFVIYPANTFKNQPTALNDNTHFNTYGAMQIAKCIIQGIKDLKLPLAKFLKEQMPAFDATMPDDWQNWYWPLSPGMAAAKPDGN
ncbi:MAG TPA: rhamnogalacturonan acetylesterase [Phnomibacter sp.]|nr:rhamnogalacturonan acetylesterase [Phnomibacter sp.]